MTLSQRGINNTSNVLRQTLSIQILDQDMLSKDFAISQLAIPAVIALIFFLAYSSQYFFLHFEAALLQTNEFWVINIVTLCAWICYFRTCSVDPGRLPKALKSSADDQSGRQRWCRRCEAYKPPRAHHCKTCKRCIPKMDHHCPWTSNCVSHFTFPHFMRFLVYAVVAAFYIESCIFQRGLVVWRSRNLPSYLGPTVGQLIHLLLLFVVNSLTAFALFILLVRTIWSLGSNTTTIESWEIDRHKTLVRRARVLGGYLDGPGGVRIRIKKQEFPYDIGIWANIKQGMGGSANILSWLWPFAATPDRSTGWEFKVNGFQDPGVFWPPPDPDRIPLPTIPSYGSNAPEVYESAQQRVQAFQRRQMEDLKRRRPYGEVQRRRQFHERFSQDPGSDAEEYGKAEEGEESWRNSEGERLRDFGVDEEVEFYDEEDMPLALLIQQRKAQQS